MKKFMKIWSNLTFNKLNNLIGPNDIIFWGNLNHSFFKKIENRCHDIYLIDDGFSTINILPKLEERFVNSTKKKGSTIHLYTLFQLNSTFLIIFNHQFNQIKSLEKHIAKEKSVFFIGQPLVFNNIVSEHYYVQTIQTIFTDYEKKGFSCFYLCLFVFLKVLFVFECFYLFLLYFYLFCFVFIIFF